MLRGLKFLHSANVLHRDLKPSNLLVNANCDLTICDFGLARGVDGEFEEELTEYVVTRWYRAPELLCDSCYYGKTVDLWSVGCIFAEMLGRKPFFQGSNPLHQLEAIIAKLGIPPKEQLSFVTHPAARKAILARADQRPRPLASFFPAGTNPKALNLLQRMLTFHPEHRITVEGALAHPYLEELHSQMDEPLCARAFDFSWEKAHTRGTPIPKPELQRLMYQEMLFFRGADTPCPGPSPPAATAASASTTMETGDGQEEAKGEAGALQQQQQRAGAAAAAAAAAGAAMEAADAAAPVPAAPGVGGQQQQHIRRPSKPPGTPLHHKGSRDNASASAVASAAGEEDGAGMALTASAVVAAPDDVDPDAMSVVEG